MKKQKPKLKKVKINRKKIKKDKPIQFSESISEKIINSFDQGGMALILLKKMLFGNKSTEHQLSTFKKIQKTLDKIKTSERIKLMKYTYSPDFVYWFNKTDKAKEQTEGMTEEESSKFLSLLATEYNYIHKDDVKKSVNIFKKIRKEPIDKIAVFFQNEHDKKED